MSLLWFDGFELDRTNTSLALNYDNPQGWPTNIAVSNGRFGGFSLKSILSTVSSIQTLPLPWTTTPTTRLVYVGIGLRASAPGNATLFSMIGGIVAVESWSVDCIDLLDGTYTLTLTDSNDVLLSTSDPIPYGEWIFIEVSAMGTATGAWSWRINDQEISSGTSDFLPSVPQDKLLIQFPSITPGFVEYDDVYATEDGYLGAEFVVEGLQVTSDTGTTEWMLSTGPTHYVLVDDPGDSDGDATYVHTDGDGDTDKYGVGSLNFIQGGIHAIRFQLDARNSDATNRDVTPEYVVQGQSAQGSAVTIIDQSYQRVSEIRTLNPVHSSPWMKGDFEELEIGMTKGVGSPSTALQITDEIGGIGYIETDDPNEWFALYDEDGIAGEMDTRVSNTELKLLDEAQIDGEFDLVVI